MAICTKGPQVGIFSGDVPLPSCDMYLFAHSNHEYSVSFLFR